MTLIQDTAQARDAYAAGIGFSAEGDGDAYADEAEIAAGVATSAEWDQSWTELAACRGVFDATTWTSDEPEDEAACLEVCRTCPVRAECTLMALTESCFSDQCGVVACTTTPQRAWLRANPDTAIEVAIICAEEGVSTDDLSAWHEAAGPETLPEEPETPKAVHARWGVHVSVYRQWRTDRGLPGGTADGRNDKQHLDAYDLALGIIADGEWHQRNELVDAMSAHLPVSMIENTSTYDSKGPRAAWHSVVESVVQSGERDGTIERREAGDGRPATLRLVPAA